MHRCIKVQGMVRVWGWKYADQVGSYARGQPFLCKRFSAWKEWTERQKITLRCASYPEASKLIVLGSTAGSNRYCKAYIVVLALVVCFHIQAFADYNGITFAVIWKIANTFVRNILHQPNCTESIQRISMGLLYTANYEKVIRVMGHLHIVFN